VAFGLTAGGIVGTFAAFPLVNMLGSHLTLMRWVVTAIIISAAVAMLRSAHARE
jgi:multisubunit Na+/H+ antiporter MnhE subunit